MSVLIKGMDMPKSCYECRFCAGTVEGCICAMGCGLLEFDTSKEIHPKCPLVEVPTSVCDAINDAPTIETERKTGKWLRSESKIFPYECDQCGDANERTTPWCPHCGAKMERLKAI